MLLGLFCFSHRELIPNPTVATDFWGYSLFSDSHKICYKNLLPELVIQQYTGEKILHVDIYDMINESA